MTVTDTVVTAIVAAVPVSALTTFIVEQLWASKIRNNAKVTQRSYEICDDFFSYIERCQSLGNVFWSTKRSDLGLEISTELVFAQSQAENKFHLIEDIGFDGRELVIELLENLTGADFDEQERAPNTVIASKITQLCSDICYRIDRFKATL